MSFAAWLENTTYSIWFRGETGMVWVYPIVLFLHTVGLGILVGTNMVIALRLLGFAERLPLGPLSGLYRVLWTGFWINAISGAMLLVADATTKVTNNVFLIKMAFIAAAVLVMVGIRRRVLDNTTIDGKAVSALARALAILSLLFWVGAITAGRLMAYYGQVSGAPDLINRLP